MHEGQIIRFDRDSGYGFVSVPNMDDVFVHVNDFDGDETLLVAGRTIEFDLVEGDRGFRAVDIRLIGEYEAGIADFRLELTDLLIDSAPTITAEQLDQVRVAIIALAVGRGWIN